MLFVCINNIYPCEYIVFKKINYTEKISTIISLATEEAKNVKDNIICLFH